MLSKLILSLVPIALASRAAIRAASDGTAVAAAQGCFHGGEAWAGDKDVALNHAAHFCNEVAAGKTWGNYQPGTYRARCYNLSPTKKVDFILYLPGSWRGARHIDSPECYDGIQKEINRCEHGGDTMYTNWHYTADPNRGQC